MAALGAVAAFLALSVVADALTHLLLSLACVGLTGYALFASDLARLVRFAIVNGLAMLLLAWAASERAELLIQRTPDHLEVTLNGVRLAVSTSAIDSPLNRLTVRLSAVGERPIAAPWAFDSLPPLRGFGEWLVGGMRGGIDSLRVLDANSSDLVPPVSGVWYPDHIDGPPRLSGSIDAWSTVRADDGAVMLYSPEISTDRYSVQALIARPSGQITVTVGSDRPGMELAVVAAPDRRLFALVAQPPDGPAETLVGGPFVFRRSEIGWLQTISRELGRAWLVALGLVALARAVALPVRICMPVAPPAFTWLAAGVAAALFGAGGLALTGTIAVALLQGIPHTVESVAYLFQAEIIAAGGLWVAAPSLPEFFEHAYIAATPDGRWFGVLPPGQSMLLAASLHYGAHWLVSPAAAGVAIGLTVILGRATHGLAVGIVSGLLLLFSPFVVLLSGDMLAHPAALAMVVAMTLGVVIAMRAGGHRYAALGWLLAGLALGGLVLTRPLAAGGIGVPLMVVLVFSSHGQPLRLLAVRATLFLLAAAPGVLYVGAVNQALSGSPFLPPLSLWSEVDRIGLGPNVGTRGGHDLANALGNTWANLVVLLRHLYGWPSYLTLALALVPFVLGTGGTGGRWDRLFLLTAFGLVAAHLLYWSDGITYGPRFTFEAVAALALLTARGVTLLARGDGTVPAAETPPPSVADAQPPAVDALAPLTGVTGVPFVVTLVAALLAVNLVGYLPDVVLAYADYNGVSRQNLRRVEEAGLDRAVVFVTSDWPNWQAYSSVFPANSPMLDRGIIFARDLGETENWRLMTRYADYQWWLLRDGQLTELRP